MLLHVPASLDGLLSLLAPCFTQPTFQTFRAMVVGQISQTQLRTVTGMLVGARLSALWHQARAPILQLRPLVGAGARAAARGSDRRAAARSRCAAGRAGR